MIKTNFPSEGIAEEGNPPVRNREVEAQIGQIRRGKVMSFIRKSQEEGGGMLERGTATVVDAWENFRDHREWLVDNGSTASFDKQIGKLDTHAQSLKEKMQREARRFDAIAETLKTGAQDIERNKRAHLAEFEERLKKVEKQREELMEQKKKKEEEIEVLRQKINDRINTGINRVKLETNFDYNVAKQGDLKKEIEDGAKSLKEHKEQHEKLSAQYDVIFGTGLKGEIRETLNTLTFGMVSETRSEKKALGKLSQKEKDSLAPEEVEAYEKAQQGIKDEMVSKKMSFENLAIQIKEALADHAREIERLEKNLAELQATKDEIDPLVTKAKSRLYTWEARRASYAVKDKIDGLKDDKAEVGEHVLTESFKNPQESKTAVDQLVNVEVAELRNNINNPTYVFGEASNFNFKVSGFDTVIQPEDITGALYAIRERTDKKIFDLENLATRLKSTIDSGEVKKKDEIDEIQKQIASVNKAIEDLKRDIVDKIPLDKDGKIKKTVDQKAVIVDICPDVKITSDTRRDVFGNELKTKDEEEKGLKTLEGAITDIDEIPDPALRLKAYSKTLAYISKDQLRFSLDRDAIDALQRKIIDEKIPELFAEIDNPKVAVSVGISAIEVMSQDQNSLTENGEVLEAITTGIIENIKNVPVAMTAVNALVDFAKKFRKLSPSVSSAANPEPTLSALFSGELTQSVIEKIKGSYEVFDASKKIADLAADLQWATVQEIEEVDLRRLFDEALKHLDENSGIIEGMDAELAADIDNATHETPIFEPTYSNNVDSKYMEHSLALSYIKSMMSQIGLKHGKDFLNEKGPKEMKDHIADLKKSGRYDELADYAVKLADEHHPDEAIEALDAAVGLCNGQYLYLKTVGDTIAEVNDPYYRGRAQEIYDASFEILKNDPNNKENHSMYFNLLRSLAKYGTSEQVVEVAQYTGHIIQEAFKQRPAYGLKGLEDFLALADYEIPAGPLAEMVKTECIEFSKNIFRDIPNDEVNGEKVVSFLSLLEGDGKGDFAEELFEDRMKWIDAKGAASLIEFFGNKQPLQITVLVYSANLDAQAKNKYVEKLVDKAEKDASVKELVDLHLILTTNGFMDNASKLFEDNVDLSDREAVTELADTLYDVGFATKDDMTLAIADKQAHAAMDLAKDDLDGMIELMSNWIDKKNDIYVEANTKARNMANGDFNKLMKLAEALTKARNEHNAGIGLEITLQEAENIAKDTEASASSLAQLEAVAKMYGAIKGMEREEERLLTEIEWFKKQLETGTDAESEDEEAPGEEQSSVEINENGEEMVPLGDILKKGLSGAPARGSNASASPNATNATNSAPKKKSWIASFFSSLFGGGGTGGDSGRGTGSNNGGKK